MTPAKRVLLVVAGLIGGWVVSSFVAVGALALGDWDLPSSTSLGGEVGRMVRVVGEGQPLVDRRIPLVVLTAVNIPLWFGLAGVPWLARRAGLNWSRDLGWAMRWRDVPLGLVFGVALQFLLVPLYELVFWVFGEHDVSGPARSLAGMVSSPWDVAAIVVMTIVAAPLCEEIAFRGMLFGGIREMEAGHVGSGVAVAVVVSSLVFAGSHFQLLQFPGLLFFGTAAALLFHRSGRLGLAVWTHVGFNLTTVVLLVG